jgi:hypothetical protein
MDLGRRGGLKGGPARAKKLSGPQRREIARKGGQAATARWSMQKIGAKFHEVVIDETGNRIETEALRRMVQLFRARVKILGRRVLFYDAPRLWDGGERDTEKFRKKVVGVYDERSTVDAIVDDLLEIL